VGSASGAPPEPHPGSTHERRAVTKSDAPGPRRVLLTLTLAKAVLATAALISLSQFGASGGPGDAEDLYSGIPQSGTTLGRTDALVTISVYEDFQCPFCGRFSREVLPPLVRDHVETGEAKVVSEPLTFLGEDSLEAARAALAAGEQGLYWEYHSLLFENQGAENSGYVTDEFLEGLARQVPGLDLRAWDSSRAVGLPDRQLEEARSGAQASGVESTPTLVVSGPGGEKRLSGAEDPEEIFAAIREVGAT
jgi:protein-disulfide isomerase